MTYQHALAQAPGCAAAHYNLGHAYRHKGEMGAAAECFRLAVDIEPGHANALAALSQVLRKLARTEDAVTPSVWNVVHDVLSGLPGVPGIALPLW